MKNALRAFGRAFLSALALSLIFGFVSCKTDDDESEIIYEYVLPLEASSGLTGKWNDGYTGYNSYTDYDAAFSADLMESASYGAQSSKVYQRKVSDTSGYLYYQISDASNFSYSDKNASEYLNKWYGVFYKDLTSSSVSMCDAYPSFETSDPTTYKIADYHCFDSLEAAVKGLTVEAGFFASPVSFTKVTE